jgi:demethylmenaquinone methyltransferase/2-methoxy-6-polyprenyl-1,4-benzoquinol methylase/phosphoethanolamine N-methyltransferase
MSHHLAERKHTRSLKVHGILSVALMTFGAGLALQPLLWPSLATQGVLSLTLQLVGALLSLGGATILVSTMRHVRGHETGPHSDRQGATIRWAWLYDVLIKVLTLGRERAMRARILDAASVKLGDKVLDVGCGTGTLAVAASERVGQAGAVYGVDAAAEMVARAQRKAQVAGLPATFQVAPAQSLPFANQHFDVVLCTLVLHHLPAAARAQALTEMRRVLKTGGRLIVVEIGAARGLHALLDPAALLHGHKTKHIMAEIEALLRQTGFKLIQRAPLGFGSLDRVVAQ